MTRLAAISAKALRRLAWVAFGACVVMFIASLPFLATDDGEVVATTWAVGALGEVLLSVMLFCFAVVGILIARQHPANRIAWILLAIGVVGTAGTVADSYARYGLVRSPGSLPGAAIVAALSAADYAAPAGLIGTFLILLFPDGHLPSRRWRLVAWVAAIDMVALTVLTPLTPGPLPDSSLPISVNPLGIGALAPALRLGPPLTILLPACVLASAFALLRRFRRSSGVERLQLKWLATAGAVCACFNVATEVSRQIAIAGHASQSDLGWLTVLEYGVYLSFTLIPAAIGVAVLKHGLYGIDVVINKAVVYGTLAAFITGVYVAIVVGVGAGIGQGNHSLALSIAATAVVAIGFQPVRERVQRFANRLVYGARSTPYEVLSAFAARVGGAYPSVELLPKMARTVGQGMGAARVEVWLKIGAQLALEASWPPQDQRPAPMEVTEDQLPPLDGGRVVPVRHHGELLGAIAVTKKPGEPVTPIEDKLLADVAAQAGLVLRNVGLIEELRGSRERLVRTQDTERRRLERNLHDGAQQSLVSVALILRMARARVSAKHSRVGDALDQASEQLTAGMEELRELARGIHPAILTERGLGAAISSLADRSRVPVTVEVKLDDRLPGTIEASVYFVVAEALTNVAKYAQASMVTVTVQRTGGELVTTVSDDGIGGADPTKGSGLTGLADRVAAVDGQLDLHSPPGHGTLLTCRIPVQGQHQPPMSGDGATPLVAALAAGGGQS